MVPSRAQIGCPPKAASLRAVNRAKAAAPLYMLHSCRGDGTVKHTASLPFAGNILQPVNGVKVATAAAAHLESVEEASVLHQLGIDVIQLGHTHGSRLPHIWVIILQKTAGQLSPPHL